MTLLTLWHLLHRNTAKYTRILKDWGLRQPRMQEESAIERVIGSNAGKRFLKPWQKKSGYAMRAVQNSFQRIRTNGSAIKNATTNTNIMPLNFLKSENANGVANCSTVTNISSQNAAEINAHIAYHSIKDVTKVSREFTEVYDLSIDGEHEFFANGVLVHNCDPSAAVRGGEVWHADGTVDLYLDELFYQTNMGISDLIRELKKEPYFVYADSADPRLIDEIALGGVIIYGVQKGAGSILAGIEKMKDYDHIYVTKKSYNLQNELRNYTWEKDKNGNYINQPIDAWNHLVDSCRYFCTGKIMGKVIRKEMKQQNAGKKPVSYGLN